ncbi:MAG: prepilin-type N-terminal cleavage/methylation domain-containing protein [candidate division Zixibacteria bacterium]
MKKIKNSKGSTVIEIMIALLITGIVSAAAFQFYVKMHGQTMTQEQISDMQQNSRASLQEIVKALRTAGYKVGAHDSYAIVGDSLYVFTSITQPVDTIIYFLQPYSILEYPAIASLPEELHPKKLMKQVNGGSPEIFSDFINDIDFTAVTANTIEVVVKVQAESPDLDYEDNEGYRVYTAAERVLIRNMTL